MSPAVEHGLVDLLRVLDLLAALPRWLAIVSLLGSVSMLILGLRYPRFYVGLAGAGAGALLGLLLSRALGIAPWHVAPVTAALGVAAGFFVMKLAVPVLLALALGVSGGTFFGAELGGLFAPQLRDVFFSDSDAAAYWLVVAGGVLVGLAMGLLFEHFCTALTASLIGTLGVVGTTGGIIRAASGMFSRHGYREAPVYWMIAAFILVVLSMMAQAALEPDDMVWADEGTTDYD